MPLDPKKAPEFGESYKVGFEIRFENMYPTGKKYGFDHVPPERCIVITALHNHKMVIDQEGNARIIRKRERQAFPFNDYIYFSKQAWKIDKPFERTYAELAEFYAKCEVKVRKDKAHA